MGDRADSEGTDGDSIRSRFALSRRAVPRSRYYVFFSIAILGCAIDLATKAWIFGWLGLPNNHPPHWLWEGHFGFQTSLNEGALGGLGAGGSWFFASLSVVAALGIVSWLFFAGAARDRTLTVALGSVTAGILGNLYDRLGLWAASDMPDFFPPHAVRDWILMQWSDRLVWPNYNLADSFLVFGAGLMFWIAFRKPPAN